MSGAMKVHAPHRRHLLYAPEVWDSFFLESTIRRFHGFKKYLKNNIVTLRVRDTVKLLLIL
jgi:hypothetical protein